MMYRKIKDNDAEEEIREAFRVYGCIEYGNKLTNCNCTFVKCIQVFDMDNCGKVSCNELRSVLLFLDEKLTKKEIEDLIRESDLDGDGFIDYDGRLAFHRTFNWILNPKLLQLHFTEFAAMMTSG